MGLCTEGRRAVTQAMSINHSVPFERELKRKSLGFPEKILSEALSFSAAVIKQWPLISVTSQTPYAALPKPNPGNDRKYKKNM